MTRIARSFLLAAALPTWIAAQPLSVQDAVTLALEKNADVVVERESLTIADANARRAAAVYEPTLRGDARVRERTDPVNSILSGAPAGEVAPTVTNVQTSATLTKLLPGGASVSLFSSVSHDDTNSVLALLAPSWSTMAGAEIRQPLLQNRRIDPARRAIRISRIDRSRAVTALERTVAETTAAVERAYWTAAAARSEVAIRQSAVELASRHRDDTKVRIEAGTQPESDLAQATAEVERRRAELAVARENAQRAANALRNLMLRDAADPRWTEELELSDAPAAALETVDLSAAIAAALERRPELQELAMRLDRADVEIEAAGDRLKPQLDLVASYSGRGLAGSGNDDAISPFGQPVHVPDALDGGLDRSLGTLAENRFPDASIGVSVAIPLGNTAARQEVAIARAGRRQVQAQLEQAKQRIAMEVRNAALAVTTAAERIEASRAARVAAETQLQAENDRYEAGTTTPFFVLTRQNDLTAARIAESVAQNDYLKARSELARATGLLLTERGIEITK